MRIADIMKNKKNVSFYNQEDYGRDFPRLFTGIFALDYCTAGIPVGVTTCFYGPPGASKSTSSTKLLGMAQKTCWNCFEFIWDCTCGNQLTKKSVIVSTEKFDLDWAEKLGVDVNELIVVEPDTGEGAVDIIYEILNADDCGLLVLDSLARIIPEQEITDPALSYHVGLRARLHAKMMNKVKSTLITQKRKKNPSAFLATNQIRAVIGGYLGGEDMPGGFASKHDWHLTCRFGALKPESKFVDEVTELPFFGKHSVSIVSPGVKRKLLTLAGKGQFYIALDDTPECAKGESYDYKTTLDYAVRFGLLDKSKWVFKYDGIEHGTKSAMMAYWKNDPLKYYTVKRRIIEHAINIKKGVIEDVSPKEVERDVSDDPEE
jgi:RecA/RadA recombinase